MIWNKIYETSFADIKLSSFIYEENHVFIEEDKVVTIEEELDAVEVDGIGNSVDLPRLMFID